MFSTPLKNKFFVRQINMKCNIFVKKHAPETSFRIIDHIDGYGFAK